VARRASHHDRQYVDVPRRPPESCGLWELLPFDTTSQSDETPAIYALTGIRDAEFEDGFWRKTASMHFTEKVSGVRRGPSRSEHVSVQGGRTMVCIERQPPVDDNGEMKIEVLHIDECPNWEEAGDRLRVALDATAHEDAEIDFRLIRTPEDAAQVPFAGSPTITVNDEDLFPGGGRTNELACRIYFTPTGIAGLPTVEQIVEAIEARG
jgi:hypothetical protein